MVGVGRRSKACDTCRRRRIKCDEQKPYCLRCAKSKIQCSGYPDMTIILFDGQKQQKISPPASQPPSNSPPKLAGTGWLAAVQVPLDLEDVFVNYTRAKLLQGSNAINVAHRDLGAKAFQALATTFFGLEHKEKALVRQGFQRYGDALEKVNQALRDPSRFAYSDILDGIVQMGLFEFLMSDHETGWISHWIGLEKLFALRGPKTFAVTPEFLIFNVTRVSIILASLLVRRPTMLSRPEWKTIPWSNFPSKKTSYERLVDIFADCPGLFVDKIRVFKNLGISTDMVDVDKLLNKVYSVLDQLEEWKAQWDLSNPGYYHEIPAPFLKPAYFSSQYEEDTVTPPAWTTMLGYASDYHADTIVLYSGILALVLQLAQSIMNEVEIDTTDRHLFDLAGRANTAGLTICRSVECQLQSMRKGIANFHLLFPMRMAYQTIGRSNPAVGLWIQDVLQQIQDGKSSRWATAKYILHVQPTRR